jgi:hypothetical protein
LEEIRGALGTLPGPVRMPADVAGRIDAALAAEALLSSTSTSPVRNAVTEADAEPVPGGTGSTATALGSADVSRETSSPPDRAPGAGPRRHRSLMLAAALAAAVVGMGALLTQSFQDDPAPASAAFSGRPLDQQVSALLTESGPGPSEGASPRPRTMLRPAADVPACVRDGIARAEGTGATAAETVAHEAIATKEGTFRDRKAILVVLPHPQDDNRVPAFVVDASCITEPSSGNKEKGEVLLQRSYARSD